MLIPNFHLGEKDRESSYKERQISGLFCKLVAQFKTLSMSFEIRKLLNKSNLKGSGANQNQETVFRDNHLQHIRDIFRFHVK